MNVCLCVFWPCTCDEPASPATAAASRPGVRKCGRPVDQAVDREVDRDGGGELGAARRRAVRTGGET